MTTYKLHRELWVPHPLKEVFRFFSRAENLEDLTPPWMHFRILTPPPIDMKKGAHIEYALRVRGIPLRWRTVIERWQPPTQFIDVQIKGPYKLWRHTHRFIALRGGTTLIDDLEYALPFGPIGRLVHSLQVRKDIAKIFDYRAQRIQILFPAAPTSKP